MTSAKAAYDAWRAAHEHPLLPWEKLKPHVKSVWEKIADAAIASAKKK